MASEDLIGLSKEVAALTARMDAWFALWKTQDTGATDGRRQLYHKFDELKDMVVAELVKLRLEMGNLSHRLNSVIEDVAKMEPQLANSNNERQQRLGAQKRMAKAWGALIGLVTAAGTVGAGIVELIQWLSPKAH